MRKLQAASTIRVIGFAASVVVIAILSWVFLWDEDETGTHSHPTVNTEIVPRETVSQVATTEPNKVFPQRRTHQAWYLPSADADLADLPTENLPRGSAYVRVSKKYQQWLLGTPVEVHIPQIDKTYLAVVDRIAPDAFGNTTIHAIPSQTEEVLDRLILSFNSANTLAYVSTNEGSYELTATGEYGLLVPSSSLGVTKDPSVPDVGEQKKNRYADAEYVPRRDE